MATIPFSLSIDAVIFGTLLLSLLAGFLLSQQRVKVFSLSFFVGWVLSQEFGGKVFEATRGSAAFLTEDAVRLTLLILPVILITLGRRSHPVHGHSRILTVFLAVTAGGLAVASGISVLSEGTRAQVLLESNTASQLYNLRSVWLVGVPVLAIMSSLFVKREDKRHR